MQNTAYDTALESLLTASAALDSLDLDRGSHLVLKIASLVIEAKKADKKKKDEKKKPSPKKKVDKSDKKKVSKSATEFLSYEKTATSILSYKAGQGTQNPTEQTDEDARRFMQGGPGVPPPAQKGDVYRGHSTQKATDASAVKKIQQFLKSKGYDLGSFGPNKDGVDGQLGSYTQTALKQYQKSKRLPETGMDDAATWKAIQNDSGGLMHGIGGGDAISHVTSYKASADKLLGIVTQLSQAVGSNGRIQNPQQKQQLQTVENAIGKVYNDIKAGFQLQLFGDAKTKLQEAFTTINQAVGVMNQLKRSSSQ